MLFLASNLIQYTSVDSGLGHVFILPLYVLILYFTIQWHNNPRRLTATLAGLTIGISIICTPTELLMVLIPLLWESQSKDRWNLRWQLVKRNKSHVVIVAIFKANVCNTYAIDLRIPDRSSFRQIILYITSGNTLSYTLHNVTVEEYMGLPFAE